MNSVPESPLFRGVRPPSTDFQAVRDGTRGLAFELLLDLSVARSIAARTHAVIGIGGNTIYSDPLIDASGNSIGGVVVARFENVNIAPAGAAFTIRPPFIGRIPFTQVLIENPAQPGMFARLLYGTDLDFSPGINANVQITGNVNTADAGASYATSYFSNTAIGAGNVDTILAFGANLSGISIKNAEWYADAAGGPFLSYGFQLHTALPAAPGDGHTFGIFNFSSGTWNTGRIRQGGALQVAANRGVYWRNHAGVALTTGVRTVQWT